MRNLILGILNILTLLINAIALWNLFFLMRSDWWEPSKTRLEGIIDRLIRGQ